MLPAITSAATTARSRRTTLFPEPSDSAGFLAAGGCADCGAALFGGGGCCG
jgi:hypothetical protein